MKQELVALITKHKNLQGKKQFNVQGTKHRDIMYRYCYKVRTVIKSNYNQREEERDLLHSDLIDKDYYGMIGREYMLFTNTTRYFVKLSANIPAKQHYKQGKLYLDVNKYRYDVLGKEIYYNLQYIGKYVHEIKVIL